MYSRTILSQKLAKFDKFCFYHVKLCKRISSLVFIYVMHYMCVRYAMVTVCFWYIPAFSAVPFRIMWLVTLKNTMFSSTNVFVCSYSTKISISLWKYKMDERLCMYTLEFKPSFSILFGLHSRLSLRCCLRQDLRMDWQAEDQHLLDTLSQPLLRCCIKYCFVWDFCFVTGDLHLFQSLISSSSASAMN